MQYLIIESEQLDRTQEQFDRPQSQPVEFSFPTRLSYQQALQKFKQAKSWKCDLLSFESYCYCIFR